VARATDLSHLKQDTIAIEQHQYKINAKFSSMARARQAHEQFNHVVSWVAL
jgi:hypothetical protein